MHAVCWKDRNMHIYFFYHFVHTIYKEFTFPYKLYFLLVHQEWQKDEIWLCYLMNKIFHISSALNSLSLREKNIST